MNATGFQSSQFNDSTLSTHAALVLKAVPKMHFDACRINLDEFALSEHWSECLQSVLISLMRLHRSNGRLGIVSQEKIRPFIKSKLLAFPQNLKRIVISRGKTFPQLPLRL